MVGARKSFVLVCFLINLGSPRMGQFTSSQAPAAFQTLMSLSGSEKTERWASPEKFTIAWAMKPKALDRKIFWVWVLFLVPFSFQSVLQFPNNKLGTHTWQENSFFASLWTCGWPHCASLERKKEIKALFHRDRIFLALLSGFGVRFVWIISLLVLLYPSLVHRR